MIYFEQEGVNVRMSAVGSLAVFSGSFDDSVAVGSVSDIVQVNGVFGTQVFTPFFSHAYGFATPTSLSVVVSGSDSAGASTFGYVGSQLLFDSSDVTGGVVGGFVTEITWDASKDFAILEDTDLATIGVAGFDNVLAWTATTGGANTISLTAGAPPAAGVPEPSGVLLSCLGLSSLALRRNRKA